MFLFGKSRNLSLSVTNFKAYGTAQIQTHQSLGKEKFEARWKYVSHKFAFSEVKQTASTTSALLADNLEQDRSVMKSVRRS